MLALALLTASLSPSLSPGGPDPSDATHLRFEPDVDRALMVTYKSEQRWDYEPGWFGEIATELELRWIFEKDSDPLEDKWLATGTILAASYVGTGEKKGTPFDHDVAWTKADGYERGEGSDAAKKWLDEEVAREIRFTFDARAAADPGVC